MNFSGAFVYQPPLTELGHQIGQGAFLIKFVAVKDDLTNVFGPELDVNLAVVLAYPQYPYEAIWPLTILNKDLTGSGMAVITANFGNGQPPGPWMPAAIVIENGDFAVGIITAAAPAVADAGLPITLGGGQATVQGR